MFAYLFVVYLLLLCCLNKNTGIESSYSKTPANDNEFKEGKRSVVYNDDDDDDDDGENSSISEGTAILSNTDKI